MNRKKDYKNIEKWRDTCHRQRLKYYRQTSFAKNHRTPWTNKEIEIVMAHEYPDRIISEMIGRSMQSIQVVRCRENKNRIRSKPNEQC